MENSHKLQLEVLYRISQALVHYQDVSALMQEVLDILETEMGMWRGTLTLRHMDSNDLNIEASKGLTAGEIKRGRYKVGEGITGRVAATGEPAVIPDISKEPSFLDRTRSRGSASVAFICVPIVHQHEVIGTMSIDCPASDERILDQNLSFLMIIANVLAEAVSSIRSQVQEREALLAENRKLRMELGDQYRPSNIIGNCAAMRAVYMQIAQVANSQATVIVRGESGTGKELVARAVHYASERKNGPFIAVNCAALPENLIESELFGHEKGAFTGAIQRRQGRFELANGGTLFLDEIGDISTAVQVRLLRVLQEKVFERVGGAESIHSNVRVVTATRRDLEKAIVDGRFREDLYFRLNVFPIHLPPLRERRSDIVLLADHFLARCNERYARTIKRISTPAINMMMSYHWPGNVRELENCIEYAVLNTGDDVIHGFNLPPSLQTAKETHTEFIPSEGASLEGLLGAYEREILVDALKTHRGNCSAAARALQATPRIFNYRVKRHHIDIDSFRVGS